MSRLVDDCQNDIVPENRHASFIFLPQIFTDETGTFHQWKKVVAALLHGSLLQLLTVLVRMNQSMHFADLGSCSQQ